MDTNHWNEVKKSFRKVTVTLPQGVYEQLIQESARRKIAGGAGPRVPTERTPSPFRSRLKPPSSA
jgi:hypothetical protein